MVACGMGRLRASEMICDSVNAKSLWSEGGPDCMPRVRSVSFYMDTRPPPPIATLGQLHSGQPHWFWAHCGMCSRQRAIPLAPFVIRWGTDASSDMLRRNLTCSHCGHRGASLQHPSWVDTQIGVQPFPTKQAH